MIKKTTSRIFGFKYQYSQEFLDHLAEIFGIKWTKVEMKSLWLKEISQKPLNKPMGILLYISTTRK